MDLIVAAVWSPLKLKPELVTVGQLDWILTRSPAFVKTVRLFWWSKEKPREDFLEWREKLPERWRPSIFICFPSTVIRRSYSEGSAGQVRHSVNPFKLIMSSWMWRHKERVSGNDILTKLCATKLDLVISHQSIIIRLKLPVLNFF